MKKITLFLSMLATMSTLACWYQRINYNDYIYAINTYERHVIETESVNSKITKTIYTVKNNQIVDLPMTVSMKLVSNTPVYIDDSTKKPTLLTGKLQYRVLPNGNWVTVEEFKRPTGTLPIELPPSTYFDRNNIMPRNLKAGDVIMVRMYLTDGIWQTGDITSMCDAIKDDTLKNNKKANSWTLPSTMGPYIINDNGSMLNYDLGGMWAPHYVFTVIFSGNYRPIR